MQSAGVLEARAAVGRASARPGLLARPLWLSIPRPDQREASATADCLRQVLAAAPSAYASAPENRQAKEPHSEPAAGVCPTPHAIPPPYVAPKQATAPAIVFPHLADTHLAPWTAIAGPAIA